MRDIWIPNSQHKPAQSRFSWIFFSISEKIYCCKENTSVILCKSLELLKVACLVCISIYQCKCSSKDVYLNCYIFFFFLTVRNVKCVSIAVYKYSWKSPCRIVMFRWNKFSLGKLSTFASHMYCSQTHLNSTVHICVLLAQPL